MVTERVDALLSSCPPGEVSEREFWGAQYDHGLAFVRARASTIEGGTSEIMRNVLAERVLGLPNDQREDREVAWRDVPR